MALSSHPKKQKTVAAFTQERDLVVVADEAYEDLVYDGEHFSIASIEGMFERTITCFTFSKSYAMTGWRLGYAVAPEPWMTGLRKALLYSSNGVSTPTQWAGLAAMSIDVATLDGIKDEYRVRRDLLLKGLNDIGLPANPQQVRSMLSLTSAGSAKTVEKLLIRYSTVQTLRRFRESSSAQKAKGICVFLFPLQSKP